MTRLITFHIFYAHLYAFFYTFNDYIALSIAILVLIYPNPNVKYGFYYTDLSP